MILKVLQALCSCCSTRLALQKTNLFTEGEITKSVMDIVDLFSLLSMSFKLCLTANE